MDLDLSDPSEFGFDRSRLERLDQHLLTRYLEPERLPHAQMLLSRAGRPFHYFNRGTAREDGSPLLDDAMFRIASMTKPITSIAYMMLLEEGVTALDDPVARVIPEFKELKVYSSGGEGVPFATDDCRPMRMVDLLRHTSGLTYGFQQRTNVDAAYREHELDSVRVNLDNDEYVSTLAGIPLEFEPGAAWNYSVSTDVLGVVVARLSGMSLGEFFQSRIFDPLGMVDTHFQCPPEKKHRLPDAYGWGPERRLTVVDRGDTSAWLTPPTFESGGGGLVSTTADYHRFCTMLLNAGRLDRERLIAPSTLQLMTANHLPGGGDLTQLSQSLFSESANEGIGFGLGFAVNMNPARTLIPGAIGEFYWGGMYSTAFFVDPLNQLTMVFMTQLTPSNSYPLRRGLKTLIYSAMTSDKRS